MITQSIRSGLAPEWFGTYRQDAEAGQRLQLSGDTEGLQIARFGSGQRGHVVFEGYLVERDSLGSDLPVNVLHASEAELIACAWQRMGKALFSRLRGRYLLAIVDEDAGECYLTHDAMGLHPLYHSRPGQNLLFASNIFALAYSGRIPRTPNKLSLALHLAGTNIEARQTFFSGISRLHPGSYLQVDPRGQFSEQQFWKIIPEHENSVIDVEEAQGLFEMAFERAVERCMSRRPHGIMLSGGLDSISVASLATRYARRNLLPPLIACAGQTPPDFPPSWEDAVQKDVADRLGLVLWSSNSRDRLKGRPMLDATMDEVLLFPQPGDVWWAGAANSFLRAAADRGHTSLLTGSGGDEWMGLHPAYAADLLRNGQLFALTQLLQAESRSQGSTNWGVIRKILWESGLKQLLRGPLGRFAPSWFAARHLKGIEGSLANGPPFTREISQGISSVLNSRILPWFAAEGGPVSNHYRHALINGWKNPQMFRENERQFHVSRAIGVDLFHPFHDQDLVALCNNLPAACFLGSSRYKTMLRGLVAREIPGLGLEKQIKRSATPGEGYVYSEFRNRFPALQSQYPPMWLKEQEILEACTVPVNAPTSTTDIDTSIVLKMGLATTEHWCRTHFA